jgi:hypothetical protein
LEDEENDRGILGLGDLKTSNDIMGIMNVHIRKACEAISSEKQIRPSRALLFTKTEFYAHIENLLNQIIQKNIICMIGLTIAILDWIESSLNKQKKSDYGLKDGILENTVCTPVFSN